MAHINLDMKTFLKIVPLIKRDNCFYPEIGLNKNTVLSIECPINISCVGDNGLNYRGHSGNFYYWFKKDKGQYNLHFSVKKLALSHLSDMMEVVWTKEYHYGDLIKFIHAVNKNPVLLFDRNNGA